MMTITLPLLDIAAIVGALFVLGCAFCFIAFLGHGMEPSEDVEIPPKPFQWRP